MRPQPAAASRRSYPVLRSAAAIPAIERSSGRLRGLVAAAPGAQQLDLDRVHRIDVRVAQPDRALHDRVAVEQLVRLDDREHRVDRAPMLVGERRPEPVAIGSRRHERDVGLGDLEARLRERHLEVLDERAEERPLARRAAAARRAARPRARTRGTPSRSRTRPAAGSGSASRRTPTGSRAAPRARPLRRPPAATPAGSRSRAAPARRPA